MKKIIFITFLGFLFFTVNAVAQSVTGKITDQQQQPLEYVNIQIGPDYGVVSNTEGVFTITLPSSTEANSVIISCIGFESLKIPLSDFKNGTYVLKEQVTVLDGVYVTNKKLSPTEILTEVIKNAPKNYAAQTIKQTFFLRTSSDMKLIDTDFKLLKSSLETKSTLKELNKDLEDMVKKFKNQHSKYYKESYGFLYSQNKESKLLVEKSIELKNEEKDISSDKVNSKVMEVIKKHLVADATYKVKSGLFKLEDSLKINSLKKEEKKDLKTAYLRSSITSMSSSLNKFYSDEELDFLTKFKRYNYTFEGYATLNDETIYIIDFKPLKNAAKYSGKIYVNALDFAVVKLEYGMIDGKTEHNISLKFLLGVKMVQDRIKVAASFSKNGAGQYAANFVKKEEGTYLFANRSLKFTKNKVDKKEDTQMLKMEVLVELDSHTTSELFIIDKLAISGDEFNKVTEKEKYDINYISKYDPSIWKNYNILAPVEAIKNYN
ncbi:carboxypeptidase-like regulatory domain-containing protein [Flavobacterium sp. '19STA2R22 D10 B1']|uniref:carboxypeptidase-like regulatory domain-containing protein n=1 Tax=Flavobacterium aerium TaxID=3037261 RepID=UPI00278BBDA0|nr:carboxypeptidase-like regulatory domain-containing protein [Flavobacterium sp. '19STA2R22 D10 B1']